MEATIEPLLTVKEVAELLKMSVKTVRNEIRRNRIGVTLLGPKGGIMRVRRSEVHRYISERLREPAASHK